MLEHSLANPDKKQPAIRPNYAARRVGALAVAGLAAFGAVKGYDYIKNAVEHYKLYGELTKPDAMEKYKAGDIDPSKVVVVTAGKASNPLELARAIDSEKRGTTLPLSHEISKQAGADGVQPGEQFVVERSLVDDETIKTFEKNSVE